MSDAASLRSEDRDGVVVAGISGEVDLANARRLGDQLIEMVPNHSPGVVIDLSETTYLDSSGVSLVFELAERMRSRQQRVCVAVPEEAPLRRVLRVVNLESVVPLTASVEEAVEEIRREA